jgi:hypothetical protein
MVSNKNRKTSYKDLSVTKDAARQFDDLASDGETRTDTLLKIIEGYKRKCLDQTAQA